MLLTAKWVLPVSTKPIKDGAVLVKKERIKKVGKAAELKKAYPKEEIVNFGQAVILPGFVDTHTHLEYSVFRGIIDDLAFTPWKIELTKRANKLAKSDWLASAQLGALEAISSGITTIADITKSGVSLLAAKDAHLRGIIFYEVSGMDNSKVKKIMAETRKGIDEWRKRSLGTRLQIGASPYSSYTVAPTLFKAVSDFARDEKLTVSLHVAGSKDELVFIRYGSSALATVYRELMGWDDVLWQPMGVTPVKYLQQWDTFESGRVIAVHCIQVTEADIDILKKYDVAIAHCPKCSAKLGMGIAPLASLLERGFKIGLGTDSPASNNTMDLIDEMRTGLLLQRGKESSVENLDAERFVRMATLGGAEVLGLEKEIGSLEEGKYADIIAVSFSHSHQVPIADPYSSLVYTANQEDVTFTMVGGEVLYADDECTSLDKEEIFKKTEPVRAKIR